MDHRVMSDAGREFGVPVRCAHIVDARFNEAEDADRHDDEDADDNSDKQMMKLLQSHGGSNVGLQKSLLHRIIRW
jgi:hypothetical protein